MSFISIEFMIFFSIVVLIYWYLPQKYQNMWMVFASYYFYACWSVEFVLILFIVTFSTYVCARCMKGIYKKQIILAGLLGNLLLLFIFKFGNFEINVFNSIFNVMKMPGNTINIVLPIGLSFYMLQALGYVIDVYRGELEAERNFIRYAAYVCFFPTIISGPIERSNNLLKQLQYGKEFSYEKAKRGALFIVWGFYEKILIADRIAILVEQIYSNYLEWEGAAILFATVLYGIQIYIDFAGYSNIVVGIAQILGYDIISNFRQPYFSLNVREFWKRWHISLSQWLRDYVYIPLGGNKCEKWKQYRNLLITFMVSGVWHGNGIKYLVWGGIHGIYQIMGRILAGYRKRIKGELRINDKCWSYHVFQAIITFALIDFAWLFFGANSFSHAVKLLNRILYQFHLGEFVCSKNYLLGMDESRFALLLLEILIVLLVDVFHERKVSIISWLNGQNVVFRWGVYYILVFAVLIGMLYNYGVKASTFIYATF